MPQVFANAARTTFDERGNYVVDRNLVAAVEQSRLVESIAKFRD